MVGGQRFAIVDVEHAMVEMMVVPYARVGDSNSGSSWEDSTSTILLVYDTCETAT